MKIKDIFDIIQGHQITDEAIYQDIINKGDVQILTANNNIKGYWLHSIIKEDDLPCISYPSKGNGGVCFIQNTLFDANNTAVLIPKKKWRNRIYLEWVAFKLSKDFLKIKTSKEGVSYLNKEIVVELELDILDYDVQKIQFKSISKLLRLKEACGSILDKINKIKTAHLLVDYKKYQGKDISAKKIFNSFSGNSGLTKEYLYQNTLFGENKIYKVLTGSVDVNDVDLTNQCLHPKNKKKQIEVLSGEGIHIVRKGINAGFINYLPDDNYTLNDDAYILVKLENCNYELSMRWFVYAHRYLFMEYSSKTDNGTWNKTGFFDYATFDIPSTIEQDDIVKRFEQLEIYENKLMNIEKHIVNILSKEIIDIEKPFLNR